MGENLDLAGRLPVRTPMQWTPYGTGGGFSEAPLDQWVRQPLTSGEFAAQKVNVAVQRGDPDSLLNWIASLIRTRKECGEIGVGDWQSLDTGSDGVLGLRCDVPGCSVITLNNLSPKKQRVALDLTDDEIERATQLLGDHHYDLRKAQALDVPGYGHLWLRIGGVY